MCKGEFEDNADRDSQHQWSGNGAQEEQLRGQSQRTYERLLSQVLQRSIVGDCL